MTEVAAIEQVTHSLIRLNHAAVATFPEAFPGFPSYRKLITTCLYGMHEHVNNNMYAKNIYLFMVGKRWRQKGDPTGLDGSLIPLWVSALHDAPAEATPFPGSINLTFTNYMN
jgi:hypothetical protein